MSPPAPLTPGTRRRTLRFATRGSPLALKQAEIVRELVDRSLGGQVETELVIVETAGDRTQNLPLHEVGGQGIFVKDVERAVLEGRADAAVHSAKDLPASAPVLPIVAVPPRGDPRDALVGCRLAELRPGAKVATGSVRRRAQLAWMRPGLTFVELRGNIGTRLSKLPTGGAVVVAAAALARLGLSDQAAEILSPLTMLPQVGQGTIAVCARPDDEDVASLLAAVDDAPSRRGLEAERAYLAAVGGGCELPVGAYCRVDEDGRITLDAMIASLDGHTIVRESMTGADPRMVGAALAKLVLDQSGARSLLEPFGAGAPIVSGIGVAALDTARFGARPLSGWRVVVTRSLAQASGLVELLRDAGAEPIEVPTIEIVDPADGGRALDTALARLDSFGWVAFASANAVERTFGRLTDARVLGGVKVAAVGRATAAALSARGVKADLVPSVAVAEELVKAFGPADPPGTRVLLPQAAGARDALRDGLRALGYEVETVEAYRTTHPEPGEDTASLLESAHAITFSSSSTVEGFLGAYGRDLVPPVVASIGPVTTATARVHGLHVDVEASEASIEALVAGLAAHAAQRAKG